MNSYLKAMHCMLHRPLRNILIYFLITLLNITFLVYQIQAIKGLFSFDKHYQVIYFEN